MNLKLFLTLIGLVFESSLALNGSSVSVCSSESQETVVNISPRKNASQSSTHHTFSADLAIDGDVDTFQHTDNERNPHWQIDLEKVHPIRRIVIVNRKDLCCGSRLHDVEIYVGPTEDSMSFFAKYKGPAKEGQHLIFICTHITTGRYAKIILNTTEPLHMAEVEVYVPDETTATITQQSTYTMYRTTFVTADQSNIQTTLDVEQPVSTEQSPDVCSCPCPKVNNKWSYLEGLNLTYSELKEAMKQDLIKLEKKLLVDKKNISSAIRRLTSAPDDRKSSANMGVFAVILTCLPICFCVFADCSRFCCSDRKKKEKEKERS